MTGMMQPGPTLYEDEQRRKKKGSQGLLAAIGEPMSYSPNPLVNALGGGLLGAQYLTGEKPLDEGLSALSMMTGLLQGTKVAPIMRNAIKVYHGSPHKFDKADSSHIGKGEGAQAYGHGLYWAESPGVADNYRKNLSDMTFSVAGKELVGPATKYGTTGQSAARKKLSMPEKMATYALDNVIKNDKSSNTAASAINQLQKYGKDDPDAKAAIELIKKWDSQGRIVEQGNLYEASLRWPDAAREAADPLSAKHFLDWDKPLSQQPESVRKALASIPRSERGVNVDESNTAYDLLNGLTRGKFNNPANADRAVAASARINKTGIPGITYLDAGSRAAGQGTRNYVTFDDNLVELLKRNGMGLLGK